MLMLSRYNVYHVHHCSLACWHANICQLALNKSDKLKVWPDDGTRWKVRELLNNEGDINIWTQLNVNPSSSCWKLSLKTTNVNLLVVLDVNSGDHQVIRIHRLGTMNVCQFCANPPNTFWYISQNMWKLWPAGGTRGKIRRSQKSGFMPIHQTVVEIYQSRPKWWTDQ